MIEQIKVFLQYIVPQHGLSRLLARVMESKNPWLKTRLINWFVNKYDIDLSIIKEKNLSAYKTFNEFFIRELEDSARPVDGRPEAIVSPADGLISQLGEIDGSKLIQAKGKHFTLDSLMGNDSSSELFRGGLFSTIYLSPKDYHRVHMPCGGVLKKMIYIPGQLFSVNTATAQHVPNLFARNERAVCLFETEQGPMAVILVGAMLVAGIHTSWAGQVSPSQQGAVTVTTYEDQDIRLGKGEELGYFKFGSTVIVLFPKESPGWLSRWRSGDSVKMGETLID